MHSQPPFLVELAAMQSKTTSQLHATSLVEKIKKWRGQHPWVRVGPHGMVCDICRDAGVKSKWGTGHSVLLLKFIQFHSVCWHHLRRKMIWEFQRQSYLAFWGCRGRGTVTRTHLDQHAESRTHRLAVTWFGMKNNFINEVKCTKILPTHMVSSPIRLERRMVVLTTTAVMLWWMEKLSHMLQLSGL